MFLAWFCLAACYQSHGPTSIPIQYETLPSTVKSQEDEEKELRKLHEPYETVYSIAPYDTFHISVYEHPELQTRDQPAMVTPDGYLAFPLIKPIKVGGLTLPAATDLACERFSEYIKNPMISIIPVHIQGNTVTLMGKVAAPGVYPLQSKMRLVDAIAAAKGFAYGEFNGDMIDVADLQNAYIVREKKVLPVNFQKAVYEGDSLHNIPLRNNDYIYIPSVMNQAVYFLGEVTTPSYVGYKEGMTLLKALTFTRGVLKSHARYVNIIRGGLKNPRIYKVDLSAMLEGETADFLLQPNDIVYVPKRGISTYNDVIADIIPTIQGLNMLSGPFGSPAGYYQTDR